VTLVRTTRVATTTATDAITDQTRSKFGIHVDTGTKTNRHGIC
jgi:hypothetical protein